VASVKMRGPVALAAPTPSTDARPPAAIPTRGDWNYEVKWNGLRTMHRLPPGVRRNQGVAHTQRRRLHRGRHLERQGVIDAASDHSTKTYERERERSVSIVEVW
jgi:hypothetical protein